MVLRLPRKRSASEEDVVFGAAGRDGHAGDFERAWFHLAGAVLQHVSAADQYLLTQTESAVVRNLDAQRILVDDLGAVRPHNDRSAGA
jgi:hypothetical protein